MKQEQWPTHAGLMQPCEHAAQAFVIAPDLLWFVLVKNKLVDDEKTEVAHLWAAVNVWLKYRSCLVGLSKCSSNNEVEWALRSRRGKKKWSVCNGARMQAWCSLAKTVRKPSQLPRFAVQVDSVTLSGLLVLFQKYSFRPESFFVEEDYGLCPGKSLEYVWTS